MKNFSLLGVKISQTNYIEIEQQVFQTIRQNKKIWITTPNPEIWLKAIRDTHYLKLLNSSDIAIADGIGLVIANYYLNILKRNKWTNKFIIIKGLLWLYCLVLILINKKVITKELSQVSGDLLFEKLVSSFKQNKWKLFILGGSKDSAKITAKKIKEKFEIEVEYDEGSEFVSKESNEQRIERVNKINRFKPNILFVAYGAPEQEKWIYQNLKILNINLAMGVGGTIDEYANNNLTPNWIREAGFRWLWRLLNQPKRIFRIWQAVIVFSYKIIKLS